MGRNIENFLFFIFLYECLKTRNKFFILCIQKLETAINQTPISSIGRKDPLPVCMHVAYKCKWAL